MSIPTEEEIKQAMAYEQSEKEKIKRFAKEHGISFKEAEGKYLIYESLVNDSSQSQNNVSNDSNNKILLVAIVVLVIAAIYLFSS